MNYLTEIQKSIEKLKSESSLSFWNSGLRNNNLLINPCISLKSLEELEHNYGVIIPSDYREYVTKVGNGGNQPCVGMFTVEQSLAVMFGRSVNNSCGFDYKELTEYYQSINLHDYDDLLKYYYHVFGEPVENSVVATECSLDDYFDLNGIFKYADLLVKNDNEFYRFEYEMKKHLLIFSYDETTNTEFALALDGKHKDSVVYYSYGCASSIMRKKNILYTEMSFSEWMFNLFEHSCDPYKMNYEV